LIREDQKRFDLVKDDRRSRTKSCRRGYPLTVSFIF